MSGPSISPMPAAELTLNTGVRVKAAREQKHAPASGPKEHREDFLFEQKPILTPAGPKPASQIKKEYLVKVGSDSD